MRHRTKMARAIKTRTSGRLLKPRGKRAALHTGNSAWKIRRVRGVQVVESAAFDKLRWLTHGFSTRPGGASRIQEKPALNLGFTEWDERERVAANRDKFVAAIGARKMPLITMRQFHSDVIQLAAATCAEAP